jgi:hypothetical protein
MELLDPNDIKECVGKILNPELIFVRPAYLLILNTKNSQILLLSEVILK